MHRRPIVMTVLSLLLVPSISGAATLTIRTFIQDPDGTSASGSLVAATVCYGTADGAKVDRATTNNSGVASFSDVPQGNLTVHAFKSGFIAKSLTFFMPGADTFQPIALPQGADADLVCPAASAEGQIRTQQVTGPIQITSFRINNGAESTTSRTVTLNFTTGPQNSGDPNPAPQFFRAAEPEEGLGLIQTLLQKPFLPLTSTTSAPFTLAFRRAQDGVRYGGRPVLLQVKSGANLSHYVMDTIRVDPILQDYTIGHAEAFQFARSQGYAVGETLAITDGVPTGVDPTTGVQAPICNACAAGGLFQAPDRSCTFTRTIIFFTGNELKPFWRLKQVAPDRGTALPIAPNVFRWIFSLTIPPDPSIQTGLVCTQFIGGVCVEVAGKCLTGEPVPPEATLTFEGPTEDEVRFVDPSNPWKNAFARPGLLGPILLPGPSR